MWVLYDGWDFVKSYNLTRPDVRMTEELEDAKVFPTREKARSARRVIAKKGVRTQPERVYLTLG